MSASTPMGEEYIVDNSASLLGVVRCKV